jgi:hypothetical protein
MAMSENLKQFLVGLASDPEKLGGYLSDPDTAMAAAGLDPEDRAALKSGNQASIQARLSGPEPVNTTVSAPPMQGAGVASTYGQQYAPPPMQGAGVASTYGQQYQVPYSPPLPSPLIHVHVMPPLQYAPPPSYYEPAIVHAPPPMHGSGVASVYGQQYAPPPMHGSGVASVYGQQYQVPYSPPLHLPLIHVHVHPVIYTMPPPVAPPLVAAPAVGTAPEASAAGTSGPPDPASGGAAGKGTA